MRAKLLLVCMLATLVIFGGNSYADPGYKNESAEPKFMPDAAEKAIEQSQGTIKILVQLIDGKVSTPSGKAVLVSDDGLVVTAYHLLPKPADIYEQKERVTFNDVSAGLVLVWPEGDLAIFRVSKIPEGMKPVPLFLGNAVGSEVFAKYSGLAPSSYEDGSQRLLVFGELPFRATIVSLVPTVQATPFGPRPSGVVFWYLDKPMRRGFSGALFVNAAGQMVGAGSFVDVGYSAIVSAQTIKLMLIRIEEQKKAKEEKKEDKKEE